MFSHRMPWLLSVPLFALVSACGGVPAAAEVDALAKRNLVSASRYTYT